ncbi:hypothetical protein N5I28_14585 [Pseudomonas mosselii]|uniref:MATE family efflux transporter n=1 Tax=Pseudomonas mosselii TaxID=78327 RepID=A0ABX9B485_9PSED|nr:hypothetical protein [Pseudomonas mosselii]MDH1510981.1 hypothetical protein [Pseudomonas mosselii]QZP28143.1 hypothetical protein K5H97_07285 [Pseudomonas mosselii]
MQHVERSLNADGRVVGVGCPKFVVPGQLMSAGVNELQLLLTVFYGSVFAGLYSLAQWTTIALMGLFANAIGDVYGREAAEQYAGKGECIDIFIASFRQLLVFAFLPMIAVFMLGPSIFGFVFGEDWRGAGAIASVLVFFMLHYFIRFQAAKGSHVV